MRKPLIRKRFDHQAAHRTGGRNLLEPEAWVRHILLCQGPWIVDLRTPPGPEGSNGSLLCDCRGNPGI